QVVVGLFQQGLEIDLPVEVLVDRLAEPGLLPGQGQSPTHPVKQRAKVRPAAAVVADEPGPLLQQRENLRVEWPEEDLRDGLVQQFAGLERAQVVAPTVTDRWAVFVQEDDGGQQPARVAPRRYGITQPRQALVLENEVAEAGRFHRC